MMVGLELDRPSKAVRAVAVGNPRGCFQTSGVARETLGGCARSIIAVDDGDGPYGRQMEVDKVGQGSEVSIRSALFRFRRPPHGGSIASVVQCWHEYGKYYLLVSQSCSLAGLNARSPSERARIG